MPTAKPGYVRLSHDAGRASDDRELRAGSSAHYADPACYNDNYALRDEDVAYYVALAKGVPRVLEYGVGNGRIALPLARQGTMVVGVDQSAPMLSDFRARLARELPEVRRRVRLRRGDMRRVRLPAPRFPLVLCTFNTALHLYTRRDVELFLARVRDHLAPRGRLVLDMSVPSPLDLAEDPGRPRKVPPFFHPTWQRRVRSWEHFDYDPVRQVLFVSTCFASAYGEEPFAMVPLSHRQFFPQEWEALLHYNGFEVTDVRGDFAGGPLTRDSDTMVVHARARRT